MGAQGRAGPRFHEGRLWLTPAARAMGRRPATTRRFAWRPGRWSGWNWEGNSNAGTSAAFLTNCARGTPGR